LSLRNHRRKFVALTIGACFIFALSSALVGGQTQPALHTFQATRIANFRVELRVRSEVEGQKLTTIGARTYVQPVTAWVEQDLAWQAVRRVISIDTDGSAQIEEKLSNFSDSTTSSNNTTTSDENTDAKKLLGDLESALNPWKIPRTLQYHETRAGQTSRMSADAAPPIDESGPRVLTAWLLRALRPTTALPARPLAYGAHWQEPRVVQFSEWTHTSGSESGEWLAEPAEVRRRGEPSVRLQTTQEISGAVTAGAEKPAEGSATARFHAESLSTLALDDLRLMTAARSAVREIVWTLAPVEGLAKPPEYRGRLFVEISIQSCDENPCTMAGRDSLWDLR
jgi:hypothetical protein